MSMKFRIIAVLCRQVYIMPFTIYCGEDKKAGLLALPFRKILFKHNSLIIFVNKLNQLKVYSSASLSPSI
jgi:hypothetical protein